MKLAWARIVQCALAAGFSTMAPAAWAAPTFFASFTADGGDCSLNVVPFMPFTTYLMVYRGPSVPGITGAEFRIDNFDPAWFNTVTPNPAANLSIGNPIAGGCNIAFPACQAGGVSGAVLLYTILSVALAPVTPRLFPMGAHTTPSNPNFACPLTTLCDEPVFTKQCGFGLASCVNWPGGCWCEFAVQSATWSQVKELYTTH